MNSIPLVDLKAQYQTIKKEVDAAMRKVLDRCDFILGEDVKLFEGEFAAYCGARFGVGVNSGTAALQFALQARGVGRGDEVITVPNTFIATVSAISLAGARPVLVDVDEQTFNMDPILAKRALTQRTKAILPVHLYGLPADMEAVNALAKEHGLHVVEDACQAHGAECRGKRVGALGDVGCFSFYPGKNLGAYGDGGMVVTNDEHAADKVRMLRDYGRTSKYEHVAEGYNERLDTLQAAILRVKLRHLDAWTTKRREAAVKYRAALEGFPLSCPPEPQYAKHVYHLFVVRVKNRDQLLTALLREGIGAGIHYPIPIHLQKVCANLGYKEGAFPVSEKLSREVISLPIYPEITDEQIERVATAIARFHSE